MTNLEIITQAFGEHPEDVISPIRESAKALGWVAELMTAICEVSSQQGPVYRVFRANRLAEIARYIANDFASAYDAQHSNMMAALVASGMIGQEVSE